MYASHQPSHKLSRKKNKLQIKILIIFLFSSLGLIASIEYIKQNIQENIVQCWFYETKQKILRLISKPTLKNLLIYHQNINQHCNILLQMKEELILNVIHH